MGTGGGELGDVCATMEEVGGHHSPRCLHVASHLIALCVNTLGREAGPVRTCPGSGTCSNCFTEHDAVGAGNQEEMLLLRLGRGRGRAKEKGRGRKAHLAGSHRHQLVSCRPQ